MWKIWLALAVCVAVAGAGVVQHVDTWPSEQNGAAGIGSCLAVTPVRDGHAKVLVGAAGTDMVAGAAFLLDYDATSGNFDLLFSFTRAAFPEINSDANDRDMFGDACSMTHDASVVVIGAPGKDSPFDGALNFGAVHVFKAASEDRTAYTHDQQLQDQNPGFLDDNRKMGFSVDISVDGEWIVVGSPLYDAVSPGQNQGRVELFQRSGSQYTPLSDRIGEVNAHYGGAQVTVRADLGIVVTMADYRSQPWVHDLSQPLPMEAAAERPFLPAGYTYTSTYQANRCVSHTAASRSGDRRILASCDDTIETPSGRADIWEQADEEGLWVHSATVYANATSMSPSTQFGWSPDILGDSLLIAAQGEAVVQLHRRAPDGASWPLVAVLSEHDAASSVSTRLITQLIAAVGSPEDGSLVPGYGRLRVYRLQCEPGEALDEDAFDCVSCPAGSYNPTGSGTECASCFIALSPGAASCPIWLVLGVALAVPAIIAAAVVLRHRHHDRSTELESADYRKTFGL